MRAVVLTVPAASAELAADRLWIAGARAVEEIDVAGSRVELRTSLSADDSISMARLGELPGKWVLEFVEIDERQAETWREFAAPIEVNNRLVIQPAWLAWTERPDVLTVSIEPGGAFGLGDHPTTRLSADAVDRLVANGDRVLDVGCGTGVLAVLAALRGADHVTAVDIAEAARESTIANAARNHVAELIDASTSPVEMIDGTFDLVVANILAPALVAMAPSLRRTTATTGHLVISGLLTDGHDHVIEALAPMRPVSSTDLDGWSAVVLVHEQR